MDTAQFAFALKIKTVRRPPGRYLAQLETNETIPREVLLKRQAVAAARIARFAAEHTTFYAESFREAGANLGRLTGPGGWESLPLLTRSVVRANYEGMHSREATDRNSRVAKTGGSTGEPLRTKNDGRVPNLALAWRMYRWWGVEPWHNIARLGRWGFGWRDSLKNTLTWWPSTQVYLDASRIDEESMALFHRKLLRERPQLIEGYVGAMLEFAEFLDANGLSVPAPRAIATTAAPLTPTARARLQSIYDAPAYDEYRGSEINWLAGECREQNGLHIFADARLIEVVDDAGRRLPNGEVGDVVVTDLTNRVFPMIRYKLGDRGALRDGVCDCGRTLPMMDQPAGRTTDIVRLPSGTVLNHLMMAMFSDHPESVRRFQLRQSADYSILISVILGDEARAEEHIEAAVKKLRARIAGEVPVTVRYVDELPYDRGKTKYVISDVPAPTRPA